MEQDVFMVMHSENMHSENMHLACRSRAENSTNHAAIYQRLRRNSNWCLVGVDGDRSNSSPEVSQKLLRKEPC